MKVAVVAHAGKTFGGGLGRLREVLDAAGVKDVDWRVVKKSRKARKQAKKAIAAGATLLFVWGGDGTVQRCIDAVAGTKTRLAILPAGTANLLATHLGIPQDIDECVRIGLQEGTRAVDVGVVNGEHFAVMAGLGMDALLLKEANHGIKAHLGRLAYLWAGREAVKMRPFRANVKVGGERWYDGRATCVLVGNLGRLFGGLTVFDHARDDDGRLEIGVMTGDGAQDWARTLARTVIGKPGLSPYLELTAGREMDIRLSRKIAYELDGSVREPTRRLRVSIERGAVRVCVPQDRTGPSAARQGKRRARGARPPRKARPTPIAAPAHGRGGGRPIHDAQ